YGDLNVGQKGTARWTTREELEEQYKKVPERDAAFEAVGGIPIARDGRKLYIDDTATNNLILGGTRSGKGQIVIEPMAEIYSRAEEKA
ncbi:type IV secretory system conjugative DNA transfer family protein, partial [Pseudomonas aeruginosa]|uniref:type IV secretory system conjugative DNA transfer family protein n=1 Tax=Pseudomonas aeruginosa TaxID=287 RepID=UPI001E34715D|nr:type IV secretory system conjugative DNA transfer family protein [Pseudomonas aeruginosa]